jgi:predicted GNAT family acetyltransferase
MNVDLDHIAVQDHAAAHRYEVVVGDELAIIEYALAGDRITLIHTEVPAALEGHGIAAKLARAALDDAQARHLAVIPRCPYVASYIRRHQEYTDLVPPEYRGGVLRVQGT